MTKRLSLTLPDELSNFVASNSGAGSEFINDSEFVRHCVRDKKRRMSQQATEESANFHLAALEGLEEAIENRNYYTISDVEKELFSDL